MNVTQSLSGLQYLLAGFRIITQPGLRRFVIVPLIINILFFLALFFALKHLIVEFNTWFSHFLPSWLQWLSDVVWLLFAITFFLIFIYAFVSFANIIAAPFNNLLAEKVELFLTGTLPPPKSIFASLKDIPRAIWRQLAIIAYFLPRAFIVFIIFFIPVINLFSAFLWFMLSAWFLAMQYIDFPTDNHQIPLRQVREWMGRRKWTALSLGASILVAMMIPGLNLVTMPAAVAAATKFWVEGQ